MKYIKRLVFWSIAIPYIFLMIAAAFLEWFWYFYCGSFGVVSLGILRLECWAYAVPKDHFLNCPWKTTYKEAWKEELKLRGY